MNTRFAATCVASLIPFCASIAGPSEETELQSIVVTATRIPTPEIQIASSVTLVTAAEIAARQIRTLPDLLKEVPGLNVVQSGGPGGQTSVFMRGTNSNHTKVLIDGIDVGDPSSSNASFDFGQLLTQDIQKVEVLRGPQSGLYGSDAIGGVINVITKSGSGPPQVSASLEGGSFDSFNQMGHLSGSLDQFHYAATIDHVHSGATAVTPLDNLPPGQQRIDDAYDNLTASTKLGFDVTEHFDLGLVARYTGSHLHFTGDNFATFPSTPDTSQSESTTRQYYTRATAHLVSFGGVLEQTLGAAYGNIKSRDFSPDAPPTDNFGARVKFDWQGIVALAKNEKLVLGAEHQRDSITVPISAGTDINSGYAELQSGFTERLYDTLALRYDDNDRFGSKVTYRFAPAYLIKETGTKLKGSIGTGFKAPTLSEMFQSFPDFGFFANPNLRPETSLGWDLGVEQSLGDALIFGVTYFHNDIKNLIDTNATTYLNIGRAVTDGVESFVTYQPIRTLTFRLDYTYTQATDQATRQELLRRPKNKESLNTNWQATDRLSLNATVLSVSSWADTNRDGSIPRLNAPGYTTVDMAAAYDLSSHWTLTGRVTNLLNRHYQNPDAFDQPTLGAFAGVKAKF
ncbi:MAG TPA: TonB-dependent receptor [Steroidobacteraceae bacterium]|nr:TonB-dependent receptor [Steroidobacteraceae bacterium]